MKRFCKHVLPILFCVSLLLGICTISASAYSGDTVIVGEGKTSIWHDDVKDYSNATKIIVAEGVTEISEYTFCRFKNLRSVVLPDSLQKIGTSAFEKSNLTSITIPKNVTLIENYAFSECLNLTTIYFNAINCETESFSGLFTSIEENKIEKIIIGLDVEHIPSAAFMGCDKLETLTIPANVKTIGCNAFSDCKKLKTVILEEGLTHIYGWAFEGCQSLTEITIPNSVTYIGLDAFADCDENLKINIEDESLLTPQEPIPHEGYWDELWLGLVTVFGGAAIVLIIILVIALLSSLAMNVIYLIGCIKITKIYCRKKGTSAGGLIALAVIASLLGFGFWYLLVFAILNHNEKQQIV